MICAMAFNIQPDVTRLFYLSIASVLNRYVGHINIQKVDYRDTPLF